MEKLISTGKHLYKDHFDNATGKVKRGADDVMCLNAYLQSKLRDLETVVLAFRHEGRALTHEELIAALESDGRADFVTFARQEPLSIMSAS